MQALQNPIGQSFFLQKQRHFVQMLHVVALDYGIDVNVGKE
jgi:hypothetical protein